MTSDLDIVLQAPDQLPVHLPGLSYSDAAALGLAEAVLQDAAGLVGLLQLQLQVLQLVHLLLLKHVAHFQHLTAKLLHLILGQITQKDHNFYISPRRIKGMLKLQTWVTCVVPVDGLVQ